METQISKINFEFVIISTQRSGTTMLQSALKTHEEISCAHEIVRSKKHLFEVEDKKIKGAVVQWDQREGLKEINPKKYIFLKRNSRDVAISQLSNEAHKKAYRDGIIPEHNPHFTKIPCVFILNKEEIEKREKRVIETQNQIEEFLKDKDFILVSYENIDYNKIERFLKVEEKLLKPTITKNPHTYYLPFD